ncbi:MAG: hypothetical protein BM485_16585 [Desulfobulbaceae bacterium DB1]|nr:MAG: hypothetical protein BM485_16585 [Desulfobulbaceae bacterium DB1]
MKIDITQAPPTDIFRDRPKHLWICIALLFLAACGMLLILYVIFADAPQSDTLETTALSLFVGPALIFVYFGEKLKAYKKPGPEQKKELAALGRKHAVISTYCALVAEEGRDPIFAEYEACKDWAEDLSHKQKQAE